jgi:vacuolar-type H+-ATPase subunit I/STV1
MSILNSNNKKGTSINFDKLRQEMIKTEPHSVQIEEFEKKIDYLYSQKKFKEALEYSIKTYQSINENSDDLAFIQAVIKNIIKLNNINSMICLQNKSEAEKAKNYLDDCSYFLSNDDLESYMVTKNNYCCYYSNTGHHRNSKNVMNELLKINILNNLNEQFDSSSNVNDQDHGVNYLNIANDYSNICAIDNQLKNYQDALLSGMQSLALNQLNLLNKNFKAREPKSDKINNEIADENNEEKNVKQTKEKSTVNTISSTSANNLVLSYYNLGVQQEFLKREHDAKVSFSESENCSKKFMTDPLLLKKLLGNTQKNSSIKSLSPKKNEIKTLETGNEEKSCKIK